MQNTVHEKGSLYERLSNILLHQVCKLKGNKKTNFICTIYFSDNEQFWSQDGVNFIKSTISGKTCTVLIDCLDIDQSLLHIDLFVKNEQGHISVSVADLMKKAGKAIPLDDFERTDIVLERYECTSMHPFLLPSFKSIEEGEVPEDVDEFLKDESVQLDILFPLYFKSLTPRSGPIDELEAIVQEIINE